MKQTRLDKREAEAAFKPKSALPRSPRYGGPVPVALPRGSTSTLDKVMAEKEARKQREVEEHMIRLKAVRVDYFRTRNKMLAGDKKKDVDTDLILEWSASAFAQEGGKTFVHASNRRSAEQAGTAEEPVPEPAMSLAELRQQWEECTFLLRPDMGTEEAFESARKTVRASLKFLDRMGEVAAQDSGGLQGGTGTVFQELLKDLAECGVAGMMIDNHGGGGGGDDNPSFKEVAAKSEMADMLACKELWPSLLQSANDIRCIVRIKLQDANDLKAAQYALECCSTCFQEISAHAQQRGISNFDMVKVLESDEE